MESGFLTAARDSRRLLRGALAVSVAATALLAMAFPSPDLRAQEADRPPGFSAATHGKGATPDYGLVFATDHVHEIRITIAASDYQAMRQDLQTIGPARVVPSSRPDGTPGRVAPDMTERDPIYVPVTVRYEGRVWPGVGMRYKGNSSLMMARASGTGKVPFRLDFDRYEDDVPGTKNQRFFGFHKLTFASNFSDPTMLREVLATEILRDRGVPAARATFYRVFVDSGDGDEYWGLYTMIEDPADGAMLDTQFGGRDGNLYKPKGPGADWTRFDEAGFEKKTNEKASDFSDVEEAFAALHAAREEPAVWRERLEAAFDVDGFLRWLAVNTAIQNWDSYGRMPHNYYLYGDPGEGGRLRWIPWDHNMSFATRGIVGGFGTVGAIAAPVNRRARLERLETLILERGQLPELTQALSGPVSVDVPIVSEREREPAPERERIVRIAGASRGVAAFPMQGGSDDILYSDIGSDWPLISRLLDDPVFYARYRELLGAALEGLAAMPAFEARARELHTMIAPYVVGPEGEQRSHTTIGSASIFLDSLDGPGGLFGQFGSRHVQIRDALAGRD